MKVKNIDCNGKPIEDLGAVRLRADDYSSVVALVTRIAAEQEKNHEVA